MDADGHGFGGRKRRSSQEKLEGPNCEPGGTTMRLGAPRASEGTPVRFSRSQTALRAKQTRRPGKRRLGKRLASCVALVAAYELPSGQGCSRVGPGHSKPETRRPKAERNPKAEVRIDSHPGGAAANRSRPFSEFGFRPAFGFRPSVFGFQGGRTGSSLNWPDFSAALPPAPAPLAIPQFIDHTLLRPDATRSDIEQLCREARQHLFYSVCVNPTWVSLAGRLLDESGVKVCCVVSFPLGAQLPETKALEARAAIRQGAKEIDMVLNVGALKSGDDALVLQDIRSVVEACRDGSARGKVILETSLLTNEEKGARLRASRQSPSRLCEDFNRVQHRRGNHRRRGADEPDRARKGARGEGLGRYPLPGRPAPHGASRCDAHRHRQRHQDPAGSRRPGRWVGWRKILTATGAKPRPGMFALGCLRCPRECRIILPCR